jgi:hypothetical protein
VQSNKAVKAFRFFKNEFDFIVFLLLDYYKVINYSLYH